MESGSLTSTTIKKRSDYIDYLKAIAIILVVVGHSFSYIIDKEQFSCSDLNAIQTLIYSVHVPLFFVVGGGYAIVSRLKNISIKKLIVFLFRFSFSRC